MNETTERVLITLNQCGASTDEAVQSLEEAKVLIREYEALGETLRGRNVGVVMAMSYA